MQAYKSVSLLHIFFISGPLLIYTLLQFIPHQQVSTQHAVWESTITAQATDHCVPWLWGLEKQGSTGHTGTLHSRTHPSQHPQGHTEGLCIPHDDCHSAAHQTAELQTSTNYYLKIIRVFVMNSTTVKPQPALSDLLWIWYDYNQPRTLLPYFYCAQNL